MRNNKGMTLVEVMIALVILLLVSLALMQTALLSIDSNMINLLRDEAVGIAESRMREIRSLPFTDPVLTATGGAYTNENIPSKSIRNAQIQFTRERLVAVLNTDNKQVIVRVTWNWKGNPYTHTISSIQRRQ